jgi:hypothetical protein
VVRRKLKRGEEVVEQRLEGEDRAKKEPADLYDMGWTTWASAGVGDAVMGAPMALSDRIRDAVRVSRRKNSDD